MGVAPWTHFGIFWIYIHIVGMLCFVDSLWLSTSKSMEWVYLRLPKLSPSPELHPLQLQTTPDQQHRFWPETRETATVSPSVSITSMEFPTGSLNRWYRWFIIPPIGRKNATYIPLIVLDYLGDYISPIYHLLREPSKQLLKSPGLTNRFNSSNAALRWLEHQKWWEAQILVVKHGDFLPWICK